MHSGQGRIRANVGCGASPTPGWVNLDNSWTVRLSRWPLLLSLLQRARLAGPEQLAFAQRARESRIRWSSALNLPFAAGSVEVIYSSHMLEHLGRQQARAFLAEVRRVLVPGGIVRLALPDLSLLVARYREDLSADDFVARTYLAHEPPRGVRARLRALAVGQRDHAWMYDGPSLIELPGPLDLREREDESVYVEARR